MGRKDTCYMCNRESTSREHVPPKCLFPELKDLPAGFDFRKNLISVPSCDEHNTAKSEDDEYLLFILSMPQYGNSFKQRHFETKVMRAFNRTPDKFLNFMGKLTPVKILHHNEEEKDSASFPIDLQRFDRCIHNIACGIYFHHFDKKWNGVTNNLTNILEISSTEALKNNNPIKQITINIAKSFDGIKMYGTNPDIFSYQIYSKSTNQHAMRFIFYKDIEIFVLLEHV